MGFMVYNVIRLNCGEAKLAHQSNYHQQEKVLQCARQRKKKLLLTLRTEL
jgi:hypothetical protein